MLVNQTVDSVQKMNIGKDNCVIIMENITKTFGDVKALDNVSFYLGSGEIRALVGENGAGKTTLMNILYGLYRKDNGTIRVLGKDFSDGWSPHIAISQGIGMIHQHFSLIPNYTVLENIVMPLLKWTNISPQWKIWEQQVEKIIDEYGFQLRLKNRVETLSVGERQQIEILKALYQGARILILDEPTGVLTPQQADNLLKLIVELKNRDYSIVLVTHKLKEAMSVCDKITVLRAGKHVATVEKKKVIPQEIARLMIGREWIYKIDYNKPPIQPKKILEVKNLSIHQDTEKLTLDNISFSIGVGEIVGIAGVAGNGQVELAESLNGQRKITKGTINLDGACINQWSIKKRLRTGLGYIPEDRYGAGLVLELSVAINIMLDRISEEPYSRMKVLQHKIIEKDAKKAIIDYAIKTQDEKTPVRNLSGGNKQKVVLARTITANSKVIIASQPTWGLDISATEYVRKKIVDIAQAGTGVLLISNDLDEILELSHRILVMYQGEIVGEFLHNEVDLDRLGLLMIGYGKKEKSNLNLLSM